MSTFEIRNFNKISNYALRNYHEENIPEMIRLHIRHIYSSFVTSLIHYIIGRGGDFVGGIDNEALDFSQLEAFINSENTQGNGNYFGESLTSTPPTGKLLNVIVENKRTNG